MLQLFETTKEFKVYPLIKVQSNMILYNETPAEAPNMALKASKTLVLAKYFVRGCKEHQ